ncbi:CopD family protein [Hydrogenophaga sp.]|uniref:CopD family protein n=1 Tax=Hydrogenophaga sp. TaxID=1904254 RepID=UPI0035B13CA5
MLYATLKLLHVLSIVVWVGGMVFAHFFLRPAAIQLPPPQRLPLMHGVLRRFFAAVVVAVLVVFITGGAMIGRAARESVQAGLSFNMPLDWSIMAVLGVAMMAVFGHIRFSLFRRLGRAVDAQDWAAGAAELARIRTWVGVNLATGVVIIVVTLLMA